MLSETADLLKKLNKGEYLIKIPGKSYKTGTFYNDCIKYNGQETNLQIKKAIIVSERSVLPREGDDTSNYFRGDDICFAVVGEDYVYVKQNREHKFGEFMILLSNNTKNTVKKYISNKNITFPNVPVIHTPHKTHRTDNETGEPVELSFRSIKVKIEFNDRVQFRSCEYDVMKGKKVYKELKTESGVVMNVSNVHKILGAGTKFYGDIDCRSIFRSKENTMVSKSAKFRGLVLVQPVAPGSFTIDEDEAENVFFQDKGKEKEKDENVFPEDIDEEDF